MSHKHSQTHTSTQHSSRIAHLAEILSRARCFFVRCSAAVADQAALQTDLNIEADLLGARYCNVRRRYDASLIHGDPCGLGESEQVYRCVQQYVLQVLKRQHFADC
jgi:hypothetical protein